MPPALISPPHELSPQVISWLINDALRAGRNKAINSALIAQTPLLAPFGDFADRSSYAAFPGVGGVYLPDQMVKKVSRKWRAVHGTPMRAATVEEIDGLVQKVARSGSQP